MLSIKDVSTLEKGISIVAGEHGMNAPISRTHMVENLEIATNFIAKHEMIFTTGAGLDQEAELFELVKAAWESGACGIVINIGPYIHTIDKNIIDFAEEKSFPLFSCPWEVRMAEIMHRVSWMIKDNEQNENTVALALKNAILNPEGWRTLRKFGYSENTRFYVAIMSEQADFFQNGAYTFNIGDINTAVFVDLNKENLHQLSQSGFMAVSSISGLSSLNHAYAEAKKLFCLFRKENGIRFFDESGIYQLLLSIDDKRILEKYYDATISKLDRYDSKKKSDLMEVLAVYIRCGSSLKEASEILGVHKNTITNKIHKCEEIIGVDISKPSVKTDIEIAIKIKDILELMD